MDCNNYSYTGNGFGVASALIAQYSNDDMSIHHTLYDGKRHIVSAYSYDGQLNTYDEFNTAEAAETLYNHILNNYSHTAPDNRKLNAFIKRLHKQETLKKWRIWYYRNANTVCWKDVTAETPEQAIKRAKVKYPISIKEA